MDSDSNQSLPRSVPKQPIRLSLKHTPLGTSLPALNQPDKVLSVLQEKRLFFQQLNRSAEEERTKTISEAKKVQEKANKRLEYMRRLVKTPLRRKYVSKSLDVTQQLIATEKPWRAYWIGCREEIQPGTREGASLTTIGKKVVLFGGSSHVICSDTWVMTETYHWRRITAPDPDPRTGHSAVCFNQEILVTGGETTFNQFSRFRDCLGTVSAFDPELSVWHQITTVGQGAAMRRYHCAADAGKHLFLHGGMNEKSQILSDATVLSFSSLRWRKVEVLGETPGPRAFHTAVGVFSGARNLEIGIEPGIYVFGGLDQTGKAQNTLHLVRQSAYMSSWRLLHPSGTPPSPRYHHTMTYFPDSNFIVVFGGREDSKTESGYRCFGDMHLLHLLKMTWTTVELFGSVPEARCGHSAAALGSKLILFGGIHNSHFCKNDILVAEMHQDRTASLILEDQKRLSMQHKVDIFKAKHRYGEAARLTRRLTRTSYSPAREQSHAVSFLIMEEEGND